MPRLANHRAIETSPKRSEEAIGNMVVKGQAGWELKKQRSEIGAQTGNGSHKRIDSIDFRQSARMADRFRYFHRKEKVFRRAGGPANVGLGTMGPVEGRIDFRRVERGRVSFQG